MAARALTSRVGGGAGCVPRAGGASRFKSQEHPRVVIKDLDGLEADRVQVRARVAGTGRSIRFASERDCVR